MFLTASNKSVEQDSTQKITNKLRQLSGWEGGKAELAPAPVQASIPLNKELTGKLLASSQVEC